jgi:nitrogenase molybdenum-iron protein alpha/beta subunit
LKPSKKSIEIKWVDGRKMIFEKMCFKKDVKEMISVRSAFNNDSTIDELYDSKNSVLNAVCCDIFFQQSYLDAAIFGKCF